MNTNEIINIAINATQSLEGTNGVPAGYYAACLDQRLPGGKGSIYAGFTQRWQLDKALRKANYEEKAHPDIKAPCRGFVTYDIPGGEYGMIRIETQPNDATFVVVDDKNTGHVSIMLEGAAGRIKTDETWLILGPADNGEMVLYTFYPGEPTPRATTSTEQLPVGTRLTKAEALALGFNLAKVG